jgi:hypothetical protein
LQYGKFEDIDRKITDIDLIGQNQDFIENALGRELIDRDNGAKIIIILHSTIEE